MTFHLLGSLILKFFWHNSNLFRISIYLHLFKAQGLSSKSEHRMSAYKRLFLFFLCLIFKFSFAQLPNPVACYNFSYNFNEANGGPPLTVVNGGDTTQTTPTGRFSTGTAICGVDTFWNWVCDQGLDLPINNLFPKNNYTIELSFEFNGINCSGPGYNWARIITFKPLNDDNGLYTYLSGGNYNLQQYLQYPAPDYYALNYTGNTNIATPLHWFRLFLTRDSNTKVVNGYINDSLQISFTDNTLSAVFDSDLVLFKDDNAVPDEENGGTIDYMRIYNQPLTHAQINEIVARSTSSPIGITGSRNICPGDSTTLTDTAAATNYLWSTGATTSSINVKPNDTTKYSLMAWNYLFCTKSCVQYDTVTINVNSLSVSVTDSNPVCSKKGSIIAAPANGTPPFTYSWSNGQINQKDTGLVAGTYTCTIKDQGGCSTTVSGTLVSGQEGPLLMVCCDSAIKVGDSVMLDATGGGVTYSWSPSTDLSCANCSNPVAKPLNTTVYCVTADSGSCQNRECVTITTEQPCGSIFVPNAFSPNGDNVDDIEYVYGGCIQALEFKIYDRWGNMVFETTDPSKGWDGTYNGKPVSSGAYDYSLVALQLNGKATDQKGSITLIR